MEIIFLIYIVVLILQYLTQDYCNMCKVLEQIVNVRDKETIATTIINIMQKLGKAKDFLSDLIMAEIAQLGKRFMMHIHFLKSPH